MHALTAGMCAAALLAFGVAKAGEDRAITAPAGFTVLESDTRIPSTRTLTGFEVVDDGHILLKVGVNDLYLAQLYGACAHNAQFNPTIVVEAVGPSGIDRFARVLLDGRRCTIEALAKVERIKTAAPDEQGGRS